MYVVEFPFNAGARIQSTAYYWTVLKIHSENAQKGKDVLNFLKFKKKLNCLTFFNATTLQSRILTSANRLQEKCFLLSDLKYLKNFPEKRL